MKVLELFAGTRSIGKAFEARGHVVFSVEWDKRFADIDLYEDIGKLKAEDIISRFGSPDVIWASPDCATFSVCAISRHRRKNPVTGSLDPISDYARFCDEVDQNVLKLIKDLKPKYWFIENPRGGATDNELDEGFATLYRDILQVRNRQTRKSEENETDRHLDESPEPRFHTALHDWRPLPRKSTKRVTDGNAGIERSEGTVGHSCVVVRAYR